MTISKSVRLSRKGQFVIPAEMREALGVGEGDDLLVVLEDAVDVDPRRLRVGHEDAVALG